MCILRREKQCHNVRIRLGRQTEFWICLLLEVSTIQTQTVISALEWEEPVRRGATVPRAPVCHGPAPGGRTRTGWENTNAHLNCFFFVNLLLKVPLVSCQFSPHRRPGLQSVPAGLLLRQRGSDSPVWTVPGRVLLPGWRQCSHRSVVTGCSTVSDHNGRIALQVFFRKACFSYVSASNYFSVMSFCSNLTP